MLQWFLSLNPYIQVSLIVIAIVGLILTSCFGRLNLSFKGSRIALGRTNCTDCRKILVTKTTKYHKERDNAYSVVLRNQLNYTEQKIHEMSMSILKNYRSTLISGERVDENDENKQYILFSETLKNAMNMVKDEFRRAFKENGFVDMQDTEYREYLKDRVSSIITIIQEYLITIYPYNGMKLDHSLIGNIVTYDLINAFVYDIVDNAKAVAISANEKIIKLDQEFDSALEELAHS